MLTALRCSARAPALKTVTARPLVMAVTRVWSNGARQWWEVAPGDVIPSIQVRTSATRWPSRWTSRDAAAARAMRLPQALLGVGRSLVWRAHPPGHEDAFSVSLPLRLSLLRSLLFSHDAISSVRWTSALAGRRSTLRSVAVTTLHMELDWSTPTHFFPPGALLRDRLRFAANKRVVIVGLPGAFTPT